MCSFDHGLRNEAGRLPGLQFAQETGPLARQGALVERLLGQRRGLEACMSEIRSSTKAGWLRKAGLLAKAEYQNVAKTVSRTLL